MRIFLSRGDTNYVGVDLRDVVPLCGGLEFFRLPQALDCWCANIISEYFETFRLNVMCDR